MSALDLATAFKAKRTDAGALLLRKAGKLTITSGRIIACDPLTGLGIAPLNRTVPVGRHPVELLVLKLPSGDQRIALARVTFSPARVARWELAFTESAKPKRMKPGEIYGYPVDAGTGCFADHTVGGWDESFSERLLSALDDKRVDTWARANLRKGEGNVVAFSSGWGDGVYASYFGVDAKGRAVCLVTDFRCVELKV